MDRIPLCGPSVTDKEVKYVAEAAATAWYGNANVFNLRFERAFADYIGVKHAVSLPSCTSAIHLALAAVGVGPGDEVIVPEITWIASAAPISYLGATPVFADVDPESWCLDARSFEAAITPRTKAVVAVDLYGDMPDYDAVLAVAQRHGVAVIEDAAEAIGASYRGRKAGSFGQAATFSFHGSKTLTTGEGGMLTTDDTAFYERVLVLRDHGRRPGDISYRNEEVAYKYKMSSLQAAFGLGQLERIDELVAQKRRIFAWYAVQLAGTNGLRLSRVSAEVDAAYWLVTAMLAPELGVTKEHVIDALAKQGIDSRPIFNPLSGLPAYREYGGSDLWRARNPNSYALSPYGVNLPSALNLTEASVARVCDTLKQIAILAEPASVRMSGSR
jgi:perosamine synthetase